MGRSALSSSARGGAPPGVAALGGALLDRHGAPVDAGGLECGADPGEALAGAVVAGGRLAFGARRAGVAVGGERQRDDADVPVTELEQVLGGRPRRPAIVDADRWRSLARWPVGDHQRQAALFDDVEAAVVGDVAVRDEAVDQRGAREVGLLRRAEASGHQSQPHSLAFADGRDPLEEQHGRRVGERVRQRVVEEQPKRPDVAAAQRRCQRVRTGIAEPARRGEHALAQGGAELLGTVVRVRDRHPRHAELRGDRGQRHPLVLSTLVLTSAWHRP